MSVYQGARFEFEMFKRHGGRLAAFVTLKGGADVAYIRPDGTVQWTTYEQVFADDQEALAEVQMMCTRVRRENEVA